ncbi:MAG: DUF2975 domain-containing protein [Clostridiales Family XIII bacterium]|jgi:hypothetical protein|nr:DUF2975 domain-containing protein [Clostridiales Family XIII bacterium]
MMWNSDKSITLSLVCTKIVIVLVILFAGLMTFVHFSEDNRLKSLIIGMGNRFDTVFFLVFIYVCCAIALVALFFLHKILSRIRVGNVFVEENVQALRKISWLCFAVTSVLVTGGLYVGGYDFLLVGLMAAFVGLILRVVKNVFAAAVEIKMENDYTV